MDVVAEAYHFSVVNQAEVPHVDVLQIHASTKLSPPRARSSTWSENENQRLVELVKTHGCHWKQISAHFHDRDSKRCQEHYVNYLDPSLSQVSVLH